ncbi:MAG: flagellar basal body P-ring formation chaperone FlgA [Planctomycetota bacterium]
MNLFATIVLGAAALWGGDEDGKKIDVRVRPGAVVRGLEVTIGDLCELSPVSERTLALTKVVFAPTPESGHARTITRTEILQSLAGAGAEVGKLAFSGADEIVVQPVLVEVPQQDLMDAATSALQALLAVEGGDVEIEAPARMRRIDTPPGRVRRDLTARVRGGATSPSTAVVDVDVVVDGTSCRRVPVQFTLHRFQMILKTVGVVAKGAALGPQNVQLAREPLAQATGLYLTRLEAVAGMIAARNLQADTRITLGDIQPPAVIRQGEVVTVVLTHGRVKITAKALANHDAPINGRLVCTNLQSRGQLVGLVAGPGLVVIQN